MSTSTNYDNELYEQVKALRRLLVGDCKEKTEVKHDNRCENKCEAKSENKCETECETKCDEKKEYTKTKNHDAVKASAMNEIKHTITEQLKGKYGDNICVDFECEENTKDKKVLYALKINEIGRCPPKESDMCESEIYVNTETKQFYVKSKSGLNAYPLIKRSVVKCEKSD